MTIKINPHPLGGVLVEWTTPDGRLYRDRAANEAKAMHLVWCRLLPSSVRKRASRKDGSEVGE